MVIKSKGWTAIPAVKLVCFVLVILLSFVFLSAVFMMDRQAESSRTSLEIVFGNLSGNSAFYNSYMDRTLSDLRDLLFFESEENIRAGNCLRWVERNGGWWLESADGSASRWYSHHINNGADFRAYVAENGSANVSIVWDESFEVSDEQENQLTNEQIRLQMESLEKSAINNQLQSFRVLQNTIQSYNGLVYYVAKDGFEYSNAEHNDVDFYVRQPVYLIVENGLNVAQSHNFGIPSTGSGTMYVGYTAEAINEQNARWQIMQRMVILQIAQIIAMVVVAFALFIALLCGAGRKRGSDAVYFNILDKPYLDIGFGLLILYELIFASIFSGSYVTSYYSYYGNGTYGMPENPRAYLILLAAVVLLMLPPILYYTMSFAKRVKAGSWWHYTLIWRMWNAVRNTCVNFAKSLWAGVPLTLRVLLTAFCLFCVMLIVAAAGGSNEGAIIMSFFASALIAIPMLRYARRLSKLESGAKAVSEGRYGDISVGGGTLGKIAEHVNNISAGIESAVDERLKSERLKTELITNVSHDIRTPLTSLITYTDLLKSEGLESEHAPEYLDILIQKSQRLKTLTDELFEAAKASSGNIETHIESLDFAALMRQVLGELDERVQASSLDFRTNLPEHMWVTADGKLLWRAAENLLSNVFKYSLPQSRVYIDLTSENGYAALNIKNISSDPLNMDPSELTERFKRGDDSRSSEGSGLGLSIVQSFVEAQNGRFKIAIDGDLFKASVYMPETKQG